jgi:hypothetical protein
MNDNPKTTPNKTGSQYVTHCKGFGRVLTDPDSIKIELGPVCAKIGQLYLKLEICSAPTKS